MMISANLFSTFAVVLGLSALSFAANSSLDNAFEVAAIEAHFIQSLLVPSLLQTFNPSALLTLTYAGTVGKTTPGQALTIDQVKPYPELAVTAANSSVNLSGNFTIAMVDADIVGSNGTNVTRHWLVNGVTVNGTSINNSSATAITDYASPYPAEGSGAHRYVILLFAQPNSFSPPPNLSSSGSGPIEKYDVIAYAKESGLGAIVAATYITVEQGTSTMSVPATSPVMTSTLAVATVSGPSVSGSTSAKHSAPSASPTSHKSKSNDASDGTGSILFPAIGAGLAILLG